MKTRLKIYKMATSILLKFLTLKWDISRSIWRIEVSDGSFFCIFHALSFELNLFRPEYPFKQKTPQCLNDDHIKASQTIALNVSLPRHPRDLKLGAWSTEGLEYKGRD